MERKKNLNLFWFRRDLRLIDNCGLYHALRNNKNVQAIFIFDTEILDDLQEKKDRRVAFIHETLINLKTKLNALNSDLWVFYGTPHQVFTGLFKRFTIKFVYTNNDYEPYATQRDQHIADMCHANHAGFKSFKDQVIFEKSEVVKNDGSPYTVFTPYMRKWKSLLTRAHYEKCNSEKWLHNLHQCKKITNMLTLENIGFLLVPHGVEPLKISNKIIANYHKTRDLLAIHGTSRLSVHLRFGTISVRQLINKAVKLNEMYLNELIWREFYMQILWHFPHVVTQNFKSAYNAIKWRNNEADFEKWCAAKTGYPIVDAAMNELLQTGFMHNRARMIVSSFLTKHLLIDWRFGEAFFAKHLTDYELSSNNGGWQWAASTGCDAVPYFRIFNPYNQTEKFDPNKWYIKKWNGEQGLPPMVNYTEARARCLLAYKTALKN